MIAPHGPGIEVRVRAEPRHLLYVGDSEPRKNVGLVLAAYERYRAAGGALPLVLAGSARARGPGVKVVERRLPGISRPALDQSVRASETLLDSLVDGGAGRP